LFDLLRRGRFDLQRWLFAAVARAVRYSFLFLLEALGGLIVRPPSRANRATNLRVQGIQA
jgi:hypothetical protein